MMLPHASCKTDRKTCFVLVACLSILSGCGSSSITSDPDLTAFDRVNSSATQIRARFPDNQLTPIASVPMHGSGQYEGFVTVTLAGQTNTKALAGVMSARVTFDAHPSITGTAHSFADQRGAPITGQIALAGGKLNRNKDYSPSPRFEFSGKGNLENIQEQTIHIRATFDGDFFGSNAEALAGKAYGNATIDQRAVLFDGSFIMEAGKGGTP